MCRKAAVGVLVFLCGSLVVPMAAEAMIPASQRAALIDLYTSTTGADWLVRTNWRNGIDTGFNDAGTECTWFGVTCDAGGNTVAALDLSSNNLVGPIPDSIAGLPDLEYLDLGYNELGGTLPASLGSLSELLELNLLGYDGQITGSLPVELGDLDVVELIDISGHQLTGSIPTQLGNLATLVFLDLQRNGLSGGIPDELSDLPLLEELNLAYNPLGGGFPVNPGGYPALRILRLPSCQLSGPVPTAIGGITTLETLDLSYNTFTGNLPPGFASLVNLQWLAVSGAGLGDSIPTWLGTLPSLGYLSLAHNQYSGSIPSSLGSAPNLHTLALNGNQLGGPIPTFLASTPALNALRLDANQFDGPIPPTLAANSSIVQLDLGENRLTGSIPPEFAGAASLIYLYLDGNQLSGELPAALSGMAAIQVLDLSNNSLSGAFIADVCIPSLRRIELAGNRLAGDVPVEVLAMTNLWTGSSDFRWNALTTDDPTIEAFLNQKQGGGDWQSTQTVLPENLAVDSVADHTVWLSWDAVSYLDPGGYEVFVAPVGTTDWVSVGWTVDKQTTTFPATGLDAGETYDVAVATFTDPHLSNTNTVKSVLSAPQMATTAQLGCAEPTIVRTSGSPIILDLDAAYDSYLWSTGETTASITVPDVDDEWYWVTVTSPGPCEESAVIHLAIPLFADGFESGTTSAWSAP
jgi:Leucine-rich repeat (LRR) protein